MLRRIHDCFPIFLLLIPFVALACSSGGDSDPGDGDRELAAENDEAETGCLDGEVDCDGSKAILCRDQAWDVLKDCADSDMQCDNGRCIPIPVDGDPDQTDHDTEESDQEAPPDNTAPEVIGTSPANGSSGIDSEIGEIRINFSETLDTTGFLPARDISVIGGCRQIVFTASFENDDKQIEITLLDLLETGITYTVSIVADKLHDLAGNPFAGISFSFTTSGDVDGDCEADWQDDQAPYITLTNPYNGQFGVATDLDGIQIVFSEAIDTLLLNTQTAVGIQGDPADSPAYTPSWVADDTILNLDLDDALNADTAYTVSLSADLIDLAGNPLVPTQFTFSTQDPPDGDFDLPEIEAELEAEATPDGDLDTGIPNSGILGDTSRSQCLAQGGTETLTATGSSDTIGYKVQVSHDNAVYGDCITNVRVDFTQDGSLLEFFETPQSSYTCSATCPYDLDITVNRLFAATYTVRLWPFEAAQPIETTVTVP